MCLHVHTTMCMRTSVCVCTCVCVCMHADVCVRALRTQCHPPLTPEKSLRRASVCESMCRNQPWSNTHIRTKNVSVKLQFILREDKIGH